MLKIRSKFIFFLLVFLLSGCVSIKLKKSIPSSEDNNVATAAEKSFLRGENFFKTGNILEATLFFDQAVNILLDANSKDNRYSPLLNNMVNRISRIQISYLEDLNIKNSEQEKALIDDVISTPLFKPSHSQIKQIRKLTTDNIAKFSIPITINSKVVSFLTAFRTIKRESIQNALNRSAEFTDDFKKIFREIGIPEDLAYLPIIESGYRLGALSRARAMGVWQFMGSTARLFGLRVDWIVDERRNPYKSAYAAAKYLKYLYDLFGDWYLALASYNGGPGKIKRAMKRSGRKDFFKLAKTRYLRRETKNYVPAFIASLIIARSPEKYGFKINAGEKIFENSKNVEIISPVRILEVSKLLGVNLKTIMQLNPELIREFTPFNKKTYLIRIPKDSDENLLSSLKKLPPKAKYFVGWYTIKKGDSLYSISRKFRTSVKKIKIVNKLRSNLIRPGKKILIPRGFH